jgi:hypothetical protein
MPDWKCPHCNDVIEYVRYAQDVREFGTVNIRSDGEQGDWDRNDSESQDDPAFYCPECDRELNFEDLVEVVPGAERSASPPQQESNIDNEPDYADEDDERFVHGAQLTCDIFNEDDDTTFHNVHCIVTIDQDRVFLCQDAVNGATCRERWGKRYSWTIGHVGALSFEEHGVDNVVFITADSQPAIKTNVWGQLI